MLALLLALVGFAATAWLSLQEDEEERTRAQAHFAALAGEYAHGFLQRLRDSTAPMAAVSSLHQAHRGLDRRDFDDFLATLLAERRMPGLVAVAWIPRVREQEREDFIARMRADTDPAYRIHPAPGAGDVQPVAFVTATGAARERALGFDTLSDPERRTAMERAVTEGRVAMTGPLMAATDEDGPQRRSVVMYLPVFSTDVTLAEPDVRRAALRGFVGAVFHMEELTAAMPTGLAGAFLQVADMERPQPAWFASHPAAPAGPVLTADEVLSFGGRLLKLEFRSTSSLEAAMLPGSGRQVALFGSSLGLLLSLFVFYLASARRRAERAVVRATASLRASEERFALAAQVSVDAIWERDLAGGGLLASARVDELLGLAPGATGPGGVDPENLIHPEDRPRQRAAMETHLRDGSPYAVDFRVRHADGRWLWLRSRGIAQRDAAGRPLRMVGTVTDVTAERTEEDRLARYRVFLRSILDTIPDPVAVKGRDLRYVMVNGAYAKWIGRPAEEVVGHMVGDYFSGEAAECDAELDAQVFGDGGPRMREQLWPGEPGKGLRNVVIQKVAGRGPDGEPLAVGVYHDVTDLRSAFARFQAAIDTTPLVAIVGVDAAGRVTLWNRAAEDIYGHRAAEVLGRPAAEFVVMRTDLSTFSELCAGVRESGRPTSVREFQVVVGDGHTVWILGAIFPVTRAGEVAELFAMGVDVTARRKALEDLETSEARFRSLSELSSDWFWEQDAECRFTAMSIGVEKGGLTPAAALGKTRWELPIDAGEAQWAEHKALLAARRPFHDFQYRIRDLSGGWRWYSVSGEPVFDPAGAFSGYRGVGKDITEGKRAEDELRRHRDHLEDLVREQTADLLRAKDAAETANRFKSEFLANMTHELRTPMHAILSFARLGKGKVGQVAPDRLAAYFDKVVDGGLRLLALIDDLLDYSRLEAGKMPIERRPADLAEVCRQVIADTLPLAEAKGLDVSLVQEGGAATGSFDPQRFGQVVSNLLSNAIKFSPAGGRITVTVGPDELSAGRRAGDLGTVPALRLAVADEGVGIPEGELESVFDMFVQSSRTRTGAGGTGLGLAICREIVTFHRGIIRARNRETGGALFEAVIPKT